MYTRTNLYIKIFVIAIAASGILGYAYFRVSDLFYGPVIKIKTPTNGKTLDHSLISIEGVVRNAAHVTLNDRLIYADENGIFSERILLSYGYNVIELSLRDRLGREETKIIELVYK